MLLFFAQMCLKIPQWLGLQKSHEFGHLFQVDLQRLIPTQLGLKLMSSVEPCLILTENSNFSKQYPKIDYVWILVTI